MLQKTSFLVAFYFQIVIPKIYPLLNTDEECKPWKSPIPWFLNLNESSWRETPESLLSDWRWLRSYQVIAVWARGAKNGRTLTDDFILQLETKVFRSYAKISQSQSRPQLGPSHPG